MPKNLLKSILKTIGNRYVNEWCKSEYKSQKFRWVNERPIEFRFLFRHLAEIWPTTILDVGSGTTALPHILSNCGFIVTAIDNINDYWPKGMFNRHFYIMNDDIRNSNLNNRFDFITCISVLEHIQDHEAAICGMFNLLNDKGYILVTFPYNENRYVENCYKLPNSGYGQNALYICQIFSHNEVDGWLNTNNGKIASQEYWKIFSGELWTFGDRVIPPIQVKKDEPHHLTCILIQKD